MCLHTPAAFAAFSSPKNAILYGNLVQISCHESNYVATIEQDNIMYSNPKRTTLFWNQTKHLYSIFMALPEKFFSGNFEVTSPRRNKKGKFVSLKMETTFYGLKW